MDKKFIILGGLLFVLLVVLVAFLVWRVNRKPTTPTSNKIVIWDSFDTEENFSQIFDEYQAQNIIFAQRIVF